MRLGISESARATTREEARFRINHPNSVARASRIIALDKESLEALHGIEGSEWNDAHFLRFLRSEPASETLDMVNLDATLENADGKEVSLVEEIGNADVIVMVTSAGSDASAAEIIGNASFVRNKLTTGLVLNSAEVSPKALEKTLTTMRPFAAMLVVSTGSEYIDAMLTALRA